MTFMGMRVHPCLHGLRPGNGANVMTSPNTNTAGDALSGEGHPPTSSVLSTLTRPARAIARQRVVQYGVAMALLPIAFATMILTGKTQPMHPMEPPAYNDEPWSSVAAPPNDPERKTVVVLSSAFGAEITDLLPPYEVLAGAGRFNTYVLAPERHPLPLVNGNMHATSLDLVPHYSFEEYARSVGVTPDLIAIPWFPAYTAERDRAVLDWIKANAGPETLLLTICAGTEILADTGLLAGRTATTNVAWFAKLKDRSPTTTWVLDVRYHDDGRVITSTNLASGIDASLRAVERLSDRATAEAVAARLGYRHTRYLDDPASAPPAVMRNLAPLAFAAAFGGAREDVGVLVADGVSEVAIAGILDLNSASYAARVFAVADAATPVVSRNGLTLLARWDVGTAPTLDHVVLPAGDATPDRAALLQAWDARHPTTPARTIHASVGEGEAAYQATLRDLAEREGASVAAAAGRVMFYPVDDLDFASGGHPAPAIAAAALTSVAGAASVGFIRRARRIR